MAQMTVEIQVRVTRRGMAALRWLRLLACFGFMPNRRIIKWIVEELMEWRGSDTGQWRKWRD